MEVYNLRPTPFADLKASIGNQLRQDQKVCPICHEPLSTFPTPTHTTDCKLSFHRSCLELWLTGGPHNRDTGPCTCPADRQPFHLRPGDEWHLMSHLDWTILDRHVNGVIRSNNWTRPRLHPGLTSMADFLAQNHSIRYYGQNSKCVKTLNVDSRSPRSRGEEYVQIRLAEQLLLQTLPYAMQTLTSFSMAIFCPAPGRVFSVWHAWVAPRLKPEFRDTVEAVFREWARFNDHKLLHG